MKLTKTTIAILLACLFNIAGIKAQSIQEGVNHLYAERNKSAKEAFEKLVATNPNNLEAVYWLGQTYIATEDVKSARDLYSKTLQANGNAPIILVGMGHVNLIDGKKDEARQMFETAINLSTGKKGADVSILSAIGRANVDAKDGDVAYAIDKLKLAAQKDPKNADVFLNLGDAYRKAHEGGQAVTNYDLASSANPNMARAIYRKGMIYYTQKNWELFTDLLNKATTVDPKFAPAYYDLYYYNLQRLPPDFSAAQNYATKFTASTDPDPQNDYLVAQTCFAKKDYDCAINTAKAIVSKAGPQTKPRVYRLLAYSHVGKGDTAGAKQYIDEYFAKAKEEEIIPKDYVLRGQIGGNDDMVFESYVKAAQMDSVYDSKTKTLQEGVDYFKNKNNKIKEAEMRMVQSANKKTPNLSDPFFTGLAFYQGADYRRADSLFKIYIRSFPDSLYGHYYDARANLALDTTLSVEPYLTNMINGFKKTLDIAANNKAKFKTQAVASSQFLAAIYNNTKKNKDSAIYFLTKGLEFDPENPSLKEFMNQLQKGGKPAKATSNTPGKPTGATKPSAINSSAVKNKMTAVAKT